MFFFGNCPRPHLRYQTSVFCFVLSMCKHKVEKIVQLLGQCYLCSCHLHFSFVPSPPPLPFLRLLMCLGDNIWRWSCFLNGMKPSRHCCWRVLWPRLFHISEILALKLLLYVISERLFPIWWIAAPFSWWGCCGPAAHYCAVSLSEDLVGLHVVGGANTDCTALSAPRPWPSVCRWGQLLRPASYFPARGWRRQTSPRASRQHCFEPCQAFRDNSPWLPPIGWGYRTQSLIL